MKKCTVALFFFVAIVSASIPSNAALIDRGNGMIYDDDFDITWLSDANYAQTSNYDSDGKMTWDAAMTWADNLSFGGYEDWHLPSALNQDGSEPCLGYNCTDSEMTHLFYNELGGSAGQSILSSGDPDLALFSNIQASIYWSGTEDASADDSEAWFLYLNLGYQTSDLKQEEYYAWAVRSGDVSTPVPEPSTYLLFGFAFGGMALFQKKIGKKT